MEFVDPREDEELEEKLAFLQALDIFAVPATYDDPKGLSLVEAMACGVPVVSTKRGTYVELIERTGGGVVTAPDDLDAFASELLRLRMDDTRRLEMGERGVAAVRAEYGADVMATRALDIYRRLVSAHG